MNDRDLDNHPSHAAYCAGMKYAKENTGDIFTETVRSASREFVDSEAFMEGFYEERNK